MTDFYTATGQPANRSQLTSSVVRAEFSAIAAAFAKLGSYTGHPSEVVRVNAGGTGYESVSLATLLATSIAISGALTGVTDLTTTGNTILGNASVDTLNVGNGGIVKDASGNTTLGGTLTITGTLTGVTDLTTTGNTVLGNASADTLNVGAGGIIKDASGNTGIGVAPTTKLDVNGTLTVRGNVVASSTASAWSIAADPLVTSGGIVSVYGSTHVTPNQVAISTGGAARVVINSSGVIVQAGCIVGSSVLSNFYMAADIGNGNPGFQFDSNDYIDYDRTNNVWRVVVGNAVYLQANGGKVFGPGSLELGYRGLPAASVTSGAFAAADAGKCVYATAGVTVPNATMAATDAVVVQNTTGGAITITKTVTTAYNTGTASALGATFTLAARGRMSVVFTSATECYVSGNIS